VINLFIPSTHSRLSLESRWTPDWYIPFNHTQGELFQFAYCPVVMYFFQLTTGDSGTGYNSLFMLQAWRELPQRKLWRSTLLWYSSKLTALTQLSNTVIRDSIQIQLSASSHRYRQLTQLFNTMRNVRGVVRKNILMQRMVMTWNSLPRRVEEVETINNYKGNWMGIWGVSNRNAD